MGFLGKKTIGDRIIFVAAILVFLAACSTLYSGFNSGESKNSLPLFEKNMIEEVHSIAVPPFYGDKHNWKNLTYNFLSYEKGIALVSNSKFEQSMKKMNIKLSNVKLASRIDVLSSLGRAVDADAVINGVVLDKGRFLLGIRDGEIIIQIVSSKDGRVIWWQAANFKYKEDNISKAEQESLISKMLEPVLPHISKRSSKKPVENKPKDKDIENAPVDISPM